MRFLGIDYGTKKVGLALSDESMVIANPLVTFQNDETLVKKIKEIIKKEDVGEVIIGLSKNYKGEDNPVMENIRRLKAVLERDGITVHLEPEYLTSKEAVRIEEKDVDAQAAAIILQSYLDKKKSI